MLFIHAAVSSLRKVIQKIEIKRKNFITEFLPHVCQNYEKFQNPNNVMP
jgi:hypothetical protein